MSIVQLFEIIKIWTDIKTSVTIYWILHDTLGWHASTLTQLPCLSTENLFYSNRFFPENPHLKKSVPSQMETCLIACQTDMEIGGFKLVSIVWPSQNVMFQ